MERRSRLWLELKLLTNNKPRIKWHNSSASKIALEIDYVKHTYNLSIPELSELSELDKQYLIEANINQTNNHKKKYELPEENECSICLESMTTNIIKLKCNHYFHNKCIKLLYNTYHRNNCPLCRETYTYLDR